MRSLFSTASALFLVLASFAADACSYQEPPALRDAIKTARSAFVFRLDSAAVKLTNAGDGLYPLEVEGAIQPVQHLYGAATRIRTIRYSPHWCFGARMSVGRYYLAVTETSGTTLTIVPGDRSIIELGGHYNPTETKSNLQSPLILPVIQALYHVKPLPPSFPPRSVGDLITFGPPPPPPSRAPLGKQR